jgi:polyphenol oxidase
MLTWDDCILPDWPAPMGVRALFTTRLGGVSVSTAAGELASLNLGKRVGDDPLAVIENRRRVAALIGHMPHWLGLVHGTEVANLDSASHEDNIVADAAFATKKGVVCGVTMADCLPVLFASLDGRVVAAAHAGWRGLASGVLESTIAAMTQTCGVPPQEIMAYMGQAIGPKAFEVGSEVRDAFIASNIEKSIIDEAFQPKMAEGERKYWADIFLIARSRMQKVGIQESQIFGGGLCTVSDPARFFSYRREGSVGRQSGRMAAFIWRE